MAQITLFKELLKQVSCNNIPGVGFTQEDLDRVKACVDKVEPTKTEDFNPVINFDQEQTAQVNCISEGNDALQRIIKEEQQKLPTAIRYSALKGKVQELRDNADIVRIYFQERYDLISQTLNATEPLAAEYIYWQKEYTRITALVNTKHQTLKSSTLSTTVKALVNLINTNATVNIETASVRTNLTNLRTDFDNVYQISINLGANSTEATVYKNLKATLAESDELIEYINLVKAKVTALNSQSVSKAAAIAAQADQLKDLPQLPPIATAAKDLIQKEFSKISRQLSVNFNTSGTSTEKPTVPLKTTGVNFRLIDKENTVIKVVQFNQDGSVKLDSEGNSIQVDETVKINASPVLTKNVFEDRVGFSVEGISLYIPGRPTNPPKADSSYDDLTGLLYNGISGNPYPGLYRKLLKPLQLLFTLEERGLTVDSNLIDPIFKDVNDAPKSLEEDSIVYYIKNQATYEAFYETLQVQYPLKVEKERSEVYPAVIKPATDSLKALARREAADIIRRISDSPLKIARPTTYTSAVASNQLFSQGIFTYDTVDSFLSEELLYQKKARDKITELIEDCDAELERLSQLIKENSMDEDILRSKILSIPCFNRAGSATTSSNSTGADGDGAQAGQPDCEAETRKKLATDPLYIRTLLGTESTLPDITSQCYWKEFAKALNKVCLLPFPDLSSVFPNNSVFRYWPINCIIPNPAGLILLPIPPRWKPLFTLPTPLGTLVCFLTMPVAPIGIPLPSVYLFFFGIDGSKYLAFAPNFPILYAPFDNLRFGFDIDNSAASINPLGLVPTNPYKGQPIKGSLTVPLSITALGDKAARLTALAAMIATGNLTISNIAGQVLPVNVTLPNLLNDVLSESEMMLAMLNAAPSNDFKRQMVEFKKTMNRQLDKLGEMQTSAITSIKAKITEARRKAEDLAYKEKDPTKRRKNSKKARNLNPLTLPEKIDATIQTVNEYFSNIKFGTIRYPKDPTKFNPELPAAITAILDIIEMASRGDFNIDLSATSLNQQLIRVIRKIDLKKLSDKLQFDLSKSEDFTAFKEALKSLATQVVGFLKGEPFNPNVDEAKDDEEAELIAESARAIQDTLKKALAITALSLATPISINIFDLTKKCCEVQSQELFSGLPIPLLLAFTLILSLMDALIDGLDPSSIINLIDSATGVIGIQDLGAILENLILSLPTVPIPDPASLKAMAISLMVPLLSIISLPKAPTPLHIPIVPVVIPLDPILKPLMISALGAIIEAIFRLLEQALDALKNRESAEAAQSSTNGTTSQTSQTSYSTSTPNSNTQSGGGPFAGNTERGQRVLKEVFSTACGDGITATLSLETRNAYTAAVNSAKSANAEPMDTIGTITTTSTGTAAGAATANTTAEISVSLPNGLNFKLPKIPFIALDIVGYFYLLTSSDLIELIRSIINGLFDKIIEPITQIVTLVSTIATSIRTFSYTSIEAAIPQISIIKLILMAIDAIIPPGFKFRPINIDAMKIIQAVAIPVLSFSEPVLKEIAWIGSLALCAVSSVTNLYSTVSIARLFHPIMNQDDLPPWERLTHKNPLFSIFLDEIAWRGSIYSTGSLIFQTKTPAFLPYSPIFPIVHVSPHIAG